MSKLAAFFAASCSFYVNSQKPYIDWVNFHNTGYSWGYSVCTDINNNVYSVGSFQDTIIVLTSSGEDSLIQSTGTSHCFIKKIDSNGQVLWAKSIQTTGEVSSNATVADSLGNVYLIGVFNGITDFDPSESVLNYTTTAAMEIFILKLNENGNLIWVKTLESDSFAFTAAANDITIDSQNNLLITGKFSGTVDFDPGLGTEYITPVVGTSDLFVQKLDSAGNHVWVKTISSEHGRAVSVDKDNNIIVTGAFLGTVDFDPGLGTVDKTSNTSSYPDVFVLKLDAGGNFKWVNTFGGAQSDYGIDVCTDEAGCIYTVGSFRTSVDFDPDIADVLALSVVGYENTFIQKVDSLGELVWAKSMASITGGSNYNLPKSLSFSGSKNLIVAGDFAGTTNIYTNQGPESFVSAGNTDLFFQKLDTSGNFVWGGVVGGSSYEVAMDVTTDSDENVYFTGRFFDQVNFNPSGVPFVTNIDINSAFVAKYIEEYASISEKANSHYITIYPNPAISDFTIANLKENSDIVIMDLQGHIIYSETSVSDIIKIDVSTFEKGIYLVRVKSANDLLIKMIIVQ